MTLTRPASRAATPLAAALRVAPAAAVVTDVSSFLLHQCTQWAGLTIESEFAGGKVDPVEAGKKGGNS